MSLLTDTQAEDPHVSGLDFVDMNFADLDNLDLTDWDPTDLLHLLHSPEMATEPVAPSVHTATAVATATGGRGTPHTGSSSGGATSTWGGMSECPCHPVLLLPVAEPPVDYTGFMEANQD
ncbi:uncharacterized protein LOC144914728 isoform X2 [Branchiostoma floridae x Branchiostoma belcheri]